FTLNAEILDDTMEPFNQLLSLNVNVDVLKRFRNLINQSDSKVKWMDEQLLSTISSTLLRPQSLEVDAHNVSIQEEWFSHLSLGRKLLVRLVETSQGQQESKNLNEDDDV